MKSVEQYKDDLKEIHSTECHTAIHTASVSVTPVAGGLAQLPCSDAFVITPIQITMVIAIGNIFDIRIGEAAAKSLIGGFATALAGRTASQILLGWIPGVGNAVNVLTAVSLTEAIGWGAVDHFATIRAEECEKEARRFEEFTRNYENELGKIISKYENSLDKIGVLVKKYVSARKECHNYYERNFCRYSEQERYAINMVMDKAERIFIEEIERKTLTENSDCFKLLIELKSLLGKESYNE